MQRKTMIALALSAAVCGSAFAAPQDTSPPRTHGAMKLDTNGDGAIDRSEAAKFPRLAERFDALDADKDGRLSADERPKFGGPRGHGHGMHGGGIERFDKDGDGRVSRAEFDAGKAEFAARRGPDGGKGPRDHGPKALDFAALDANGDGYIVRSEERAWRERMRPQMQAEFAKRAQERFAEADINKDGKLSKLEVSEKMPRLEGSFAWMDDNRDGFLSPQELASRKHR